MKQNKKDFWSEKEKEIRDKIVRNTKDSDTCDDCQELRKYENTEFYCKFHKQEHLKLFVLDCLLSECRSVRDAELQAVFEILMNYGDDEANAIMDEIRVKLGMRKKLEGD